MRFFLIVGITCGEPALLFYMMVNKAYKYINKAFKYKQYLTRRTLLCVDCMN